MNINFEKLIIHNFKSFSDIELNLNISNTITLIGGENCDVTNGSNGVGKTSLLQAVQYALYGLPECRNKLLKNINISKEPNYDGFFVRLFFSINGEKYIIQRGCNKSDEQYLDLVTFKNNNINEPIKLNSSSIKETSNQIVSLLGGLDSEGYTRCVYLSPHSTNKFFEMTRSTKTQLLSSISGRAKLVEINEKIISDLLKKSNELTNIASHLSLIEDQIDNLTKQQNENQKRHESNLEDLINKIENIKQKIKNKEPHLTELTTLLKNKESELKTLIDLLQTKQSDLKTIIDNKYKTSLNINKSENKIEKFNSQLVEIQKVTSLLCQDCSPKIENLYDTNSINKKINLEKEKLEISRQSLQSIQAEQNKLEEESSTLSENVKQKRNEINEVNSNLFELDKELTSLNSQKKSEEQHLNDVKKNQNDLSPIIESLKKDSYKPKLNEYNELMKSKQILSVLKYITSHDVVSKYLTPQFVSDINTWFNYYCQKMYSQHYLIMDANYEYRIFDSRKNEISYPMLSSGEKMRMDIAMSLTLRYLICKYSRIYTNVLFIDEYVDSNLDSNAIAGIQSVLSDLINFGDLSIYLISHRNEMNTTGLKTITVYKESGISDIKLSS